MIRIKKRQIPKNVRHIIESRRRTAYFNAEYTVYCGDNNAPLECIVEGYENITELKDESLGIISKVCQSSMSANTNISCVITITQDDKYVDSDEVTLFFDGTNLRPCGRATVASARV